MIVVSVCLPSDALSQFLPSYFVSHLPGTWGSSSWLHLCAIRAAHACAVSQPPTHENDRMIYVCFQGKPFNIMVIQVYALTSNSEEAEVEWFYEDL